jgi:hypothetical protein
VLLDDREQVTEQPPLGRRQLGARDLFLSPYACEGVDRRAGRGQRRRRRAPGATIVAIAAVGRATTVDRGALATAA